MDYETYYYELFYNNIEKRKELSLLDSQEAQPLVTTNLVSVFMASPILDISN